MLCLDDSLSVELNLVPLRGLRQWLDKFADAIEREQRQEARRTGQPPPSPNAAAVRTKFDRLLWKYRFRDPSTRATLQLRALRGRLPQRRPAARRVRPAVRRRGHASARSPGRLGDEPDLAPRRRLRHGGWW